MHVDFAIPLSARVLSCACQSTHGMTKHDWQHSAYKFTQRAIYVDAYGEVIGSKHSISNSIRLPRI